MPNFYSNCSILTTNCYLYTNSNGSTPVGAGFYSDGTICWGTNTSGMITGSTTCPTPTATVATTATPTPTPTPTDPSTSTLTIYYCSDNSTSLFYATLSNAIYSTNITIDGLNITAYAITKCLTSTQSDSNSALVQITKGTTYGEIAGSTPIDKTSEPYGRFTNSATINGTSKTNGQTITIGSTTVTVSITTTCNLISTCGI